MKPSESARTALKNVLKLVSGERLLIVADEERLEIAKAFAEAGLSLGAWVRLVVLTPGDEFRREVPGFLREIIIGSRPDVAVNLLRGIAAEVPFRISLIKLETENAGSRLAHCPGITIDMLTKGALALSDEDYQEMARRASGLLAALEGTVEVRVENPDGTKVTMSVRGRNFFTDVWMVKNWVNLPVGEVIVAPVETSLEGVIVARAAGGIGLVKEKIWLEVSEGRVKRIHSPNKKVEEEVRRVLETDDQSSLAGEFAIGLNKKARIVPEFLESEKVYGTVHIAFGNNSDFPGGKNRSKTHIDFLIIEPTVEVEYEDGKRRTILKGGVFV